MTQPRSLALVVVAATALLCVADTGSSSAAEPTDHKPLGLLLEVDSTTARHNTLLSLRLTLVNRDQKEIAGCLYHPRVLNFRRADQRVKVMICDSSPRVCPTEDLFRLAPGEKYSWKDSIEVPDLPVGHTTVDATINIVDVDSADQVVDGTEVTLQSSSSTLVIQP